MRSLLVGVSFGGLVLAIQTAGAMYGHGSIVLPGVELVEIEIASFRSAIAFALAAAGAFVAVLTATEMITSSASRS